MLPSEGVSGAGHRPPLFRRTDAAAGFIGLLVAIIPCANSWQPAFPVDDSYISFSYALHLSSGRGLRLSPLGHPVEAFSDPLWVLILALGHLLGLGIPNLAMTIGLLLLGALAGVTSAIVRYLAPRCPAAVAALPGVVFALLPAAAFSVVAGLETLLFALILEVGVLFWVADLDRLGCPSARAHLTLALLALTRPEGALVWIGLALFTVVLRRTTRGALRPAQWFIVPVVLYEAFRLVYFRQFLPNSVIAKSGYPLATSLRLDRLEVLRFWHEYWPVLLPAGLLIAAACSLPRQNRAVRIVSGLLVGLGLFESAVSSGDNYPYERYLLLGLPLLMALVTAGVVNTAEVGIGTIEGVHSGRGRSGKAVHVFAAAATAIVLAATGYVAKSRENSLQYGDLSVHSYTFDHLASLLRPDTLSHHSGTTYHYELARLLNAEGDPLIATDEIGIVSYYTNAPVIDMYGLGDTHISHRAGSPGDRPDPSYLFGRNPRYVVLLVGGCLCLGVPSDISYASTPEMERYHIADVLYDGRSGFHPWDPSSPAAILFERSGPPGSVRSLDGAIPPAHRIVAFLPPGLKARLTSELPTDPGLGVVVPSPDLETAGAMALSSFEAIAPGTTTTMELAPARGGCSLEAKAFSDDGRPARVGLSLSDSADASLASSSRSVPGDQISVFRIPLPVSKGPLVLHTTSGANAVVANLEISCTP